MARKEMFGFAVSKKDFDLGISFPKVTDSGNARSSVA